MREEKSLNIRKKVKACMVALSLCSVVPLLFMASCSKTSSNAKQEQEAMALYKKGIELGNLHYDEKALDAYNELIRNFEDSKDQEIQQQVAEALLNKGVELGNLHYDERARATYNELIRNFKDSKDPKIQQQVAQASHKRDLSFVGSYAFPTLQQIVFSSIDFGTIVMAVNWVRKLLTKRK